MKSFLLLLLFLAVHPLPAFQYRDQVGRKTLNGVTALNEQTALAVGQSGLIARTSNGGKTWLPSQG